MLFAFNNSLSYNRPYRKENYRHQTAAHINAIHSMFFIFLSLFFSLPCKCYFILFSVEFQQQKTKSTIINFESQITEKIEDFFDKFDLFAY